MLQPHRPASSLSALLVSVIASLMVVACGGGGSNDSTSSSVAGSNVNNASGGGISVSPNVASLSSDQLVQEPNAPQLSGNTANDGFNWFNYRRQQSGLAAVTRNGQVDQAAQAHSTYERLNDTITHVETAGKPGFTGAALDDRLAAAGYVFTQSRYSFGEVLSATGDPSGFGAAEDLIGAIYHRFVVLEPMFREAGAGSATVPGGYTYFTTNFTANGLGRGLGRGGVIVYPFSGQPHVPTTFFSDRETPDPAPDRNEVGYPVSIHADMTANMTVQSFTLRPRGGSPVATRQLTHAADQETPPSAAALIPLTPLAAGTTYDVQFSGVVDGIAVSRTWSFTTQ
jgi:uncharacterized protein YkwD